LRNEEAFSQLYDQYSAELLYSIHRIVRDIGSAENILQEVFIKIIQTIHTYSPGNASLFSWMFLIVRDEALDFIREQQSSFSDNKIAVPDLRDPEPISLDQNGRLPIIQRHKRVMAELYNRGFSLSEIEQVLFLQPGITKKK